MTTYRIATLPGDGIGPEVMQATTSVLTSLAESSDMSLAFEFLHAEIGLGALERVGSALPDATVETAKTADGVLHGATDAAAIPAGLPAPLSRLRRELGAFASVRPAVSFPNVPALHDDVDLIVVREMSEGVYSKIEYMIGEDAACTVRVITKSATQRVARVAFELAASRDRKHVTATHKLAGLRMSDGFWLETIRSVAEEYPEVQFETQNVDAAAMALVRDPKAFDVVVCENQNGDILSDVAAGVTGGLGLAASGGMGDRWAYFEPVHGTAPDIAGRGLANPTAMILAAAMLLDHLHETAAASRLRAAVQSVLADGSTLTGDLGGRAGTEEVTQAIMSTLARH